MSAEFTLERIYPDQMNIHQLVAQHSLNLHFERYEFAARHCTGPRVADIACGCGYGTALMADHHPDLRFIGIDSDKKAIEYASRHYVRRNVHYFCASLLDQASVDTFDMVVSLATIEHLSDPFQTFDALARWVRPGGRLVASVPVTPTMDGNSYHLSDFTTRQFLSHLRTAGFQIGAQLRQVQPWDLTGFGRDGRLNSVLMNVLRYYRRYPWRVVRRLWALVRFGFRNHYLTVVGHKI